MLLLKNRTAVLNDCGAAPDAISGKFDCVGHTEKDANVNSSLKQILKTGTISIPNRLLRSMALADLGTVRSEMCPLSQKLTKRMRSTGAIQQLNRKTERKRCVSWI